MNRFPIFASYRALFHVIAALLIAAGTVSGLNAMDDGFEEPGVLERFVNFIEVFSLYIAIALVLMLLAEFIKLAMAVESHLFYLRHGDEALELNLIASGVSLEDIDASNPSEPSETPQPQAKET